MRRETHATANAAVPGSDAVDPGEVAKFDKPRGAPGGDWWDPKGSFAPLHKMQPARLDAIRDQVTAGFGLPAGGARRPLEGLRLVDVGCGGGLLTEPMTRLGADVVGLDAAPEAIATARAHAETMGLAVDYRAVSAGRIGERIAAGEEAAFDVALAFEVIEHVASPAAFLADVASLLRPGGLAIVSTLNKTAQSFALGVVAAEYVLGWVPRGTHDWRRFLTPADLADALAAAGLAPVDRVGFVYDPLADAFRLSRSDLSVNYAIAAVKR